MFMKEMPINMRFLKKETRSKPIFSRRKKKRFLGSKEKRAPVGARFGVTFQFRHSEPEVKDPRLPSPDVLKKDGGCGSFADAQDDGGRGVVRPPQSLPLGV